MGQTSKIFSMMGLGSVDLGLLIILLFILLIIAIFLLLQNMKRINDIKKRLDVFVTGKSARSLEREMKEMFEENRLIMATTEKNKKEIINIHRQLRTTYQKLGLVRYNAFEQMGGNLSFCLVLLNEDNDGFLMNSVHSADGCYSYTKEIEKGKCKFDLGIEEKEALEKAIDSDLL